MMRDKSQPLHLKYRPQGLDELFGNDSVKESLKVILERDSGEVRSFLLTGQSGCGKTTIARIISTKLGCSFQDFHEFNSANVRGIDTIREIASNSKYFPTSGKIKIYLLDECHKLTNDAQNALLKLLEDTPKHVRFILCTTDPGKLITTIKTRCSMFHVSPLKRHHTLKLLKWICEEEDVEVSDAVLNRICEYSNGLPRQAVVMLDQVIDIDDEKTALKTLIDMTIDEETILDLCQRLLSKSKWEDIASILKKLDEDPEKIRIGIYNYMAKVVLSSGNPKAVSIMEMFEDPIYNNGKSSIIKSCFYANKL